jgi:large subunit ribosomal protein L9
MQVILTQDVPHLGSLGDEVHVKDGFARNYLLPRGLAISATSKNAAHVAHRRRWLERLRAQAIEAARAEGEKVAALELVVKAKAGPSGRLFGSVTNRDLQAALKELGYDLDRRSIMLSAPIKNVGSYTVTVKLHSEVKREVAVRVLPIEMTEDELRQAQEALAAAESEAASVGRAASSQGLPSKGDVLKGSVMEGGGAAPDQTEAAAPAEKAQP